MSGRWVRAQEGVCMLQCIICRDVSGEKGLLPSGVRDACQHQHTPLGHLPHVWWVGQQVRADGGSDLTHTVSACTEEKSEDPKFGPNLNEFVRRFDANTTNNQGVHACCTLIRNCMPHHPPLPSVL